jgi:NAD-dependent deacetylase sirtuin 5
MWRSLDATSLATPTAFESNPSLIWQFYHYLTAWSCVSIFYARSASSPGSHVARQTICAQIPEDRGSHHLITQNVDGLFIAAFKSLDRQLSNKARSDRADAFCTPDARLVV